MLIDYIKPSHVTVDITIISIIYYNSTIFSLGSTNIYKL
jgi:hypothetical protein